MMGIPAGVFQQGQGLRAAAGGILALALWAGCYGLAAAQPAHVLPEPGENLRPLYATSEEVAEGKRLADKSCAGCHGSKGASENAGIPSLAGQRPVYLYRQLKAYQSGARKASAMNEAARFLSDDALVKVAAYYANLDPAPPSGGAPPAAAKPGPLEAGKAAAAGCVGCHGETGVSKTPGTPSLAGESPQYLVTAMNAYRSGQRRSDVMTSMLAAIPEPDLGNIGLYFALQKPARAPTPSTGEAAAGNSAATTCAGCHGDQGVSGNPSTPSLAGQDAQYLAAALREYKGGGRSEQTMKGLAASLDDHARANLAAYYAAQQPQMPKVQKPLSTAEWVERCGRCHGVGGNSVAPRLPALAAQRFDYLTKALRDYRSGARQSPEMAAMSSMLSDADIGNLAAYYARQHGRSFVYLIVPAK
jgi:cytochrome c553